MGEVPHPSHSSSRNSSRVRRACLMIFASVVSVEASSQGGRLASVWETYTTNANGELTRSIPVNAGEYFYLVITEQNGKDNAEGDGADEFNNETGEEGADGKRDDMNDHAWTTPIWFKR